VRLRSERVLTPAGAVAAEVVVEGASIGAVAPHGAGTDAIDLGDRWLAPGYIDGHVHGGGGGQFNTTEPDEIADVARFHAAHGTTSLLATTVSAPVEDLMVALGTIARGGPPNGAEIVGVHLEGPFLSRRRPGAMDPETFLKPDPAILGALSEAAGGGLRQMTVAPELAGGLALIKELVAAGILASVGHSDANYEQVRAAAAAGVRSATHVFNAMAPLHHREPGLLGAVLDLPEINCELICDGVHVAAPAMRLVHRIKGAEGMRLVTDAMAAAGMGEGEYRLGLTRVRVREGRATLADGDSLAGSTLTMEDAVRNAVGLIGLSVEEAISLASAIPARALGLEKTKGSIRAGLQADFVVLDDELRCLGTIVAGRWIHGAPA
jgi:N-acetylglucosamine-6-phosphate deacetylase